MAETEWDFRSVGPDEMQLDTIPGVPDAVRAAEGTDELREALAAAIWESQLGTRPWAEISETTKAAYRVRSDIVLAGPLADLVRERDALLAKVQACEALAESFPPQVSTDEIRRALAQPAPGVTS